MKGKLHNFLLYGSIKNFSPPMSAFDHVVVQIPRSEEGPITHVAGQLLLAPVVVLLPRQELEGQSKLSEDTSPQ